MAENTKIEWATHTFNPWEGCTKVSAGCANCYAENRNARFGGGEAPNWGKGAPRRHTSAANWREPLKWNREAEKSGTRPRVFCASLADVFDAEVPIDWLGELLTLIADTPSLDWLLLTKRPENVLPRLELAAELEVIGYGWAQKWARGEAPKNVWMGTSVEDQAAADKRIPALLKIPARVRFLSCEPLLGPVRLRDLEYDDSDPFRKMPIDWVICGGESGPNARPMNPDWARDLRDQCKVAGGPRGVAFHFKQWGEWMPARQAPNDETEVAIHCGDYPEHLWWHMIDERQGVNFENSYKVGKKKGGRLLDGRTWDEVPEVTS